MIYEQADQWHRTENFKNLFYCTAKFTRENHLNAKKKKKKTGQTANEKNFLVMLQYHMTQQNKMLL